MAEWGQCQATHNVRHDPRTKLHKCRQADTDSSHNARSHGTTPTGPRHCQCQSQGGHGTIERTDEGVDRTTKGPTKCLQLEVGRHASINYSVIYFVGYGVICRINGEPCAFATWKRCRLLKPRLRLHREQ